MVAAATVAAVLYFRVTQRRAAHLLLPGGPSMRLSNVRGNVAGLLGYQSSPIMEVNYFSVNAPRYAMVWTEYWKSGSGSPRVSSVLTMPLPAGGGKLLVECPSFRHPVLAGMVQSGGMWARQSPMPLSKIQPLPGPKRGATIGVYTWHQRPQRIGLETNILLYSTVQSAGGAVGIPPSDPNHNPLVRGASSCGLLTYLRVLPGVVTSSEIPMLEKGRVVFVHPNKISGPQTQK